MPASGLTARLRGLLAALAIASAATLAAPASAQQPTSVNPTASAVQEQQLLQELQQVQGRVTIPDAKSSVLIAPCCGSRASSASCTG